MIINRGSLIGGRRTSLTDRLTTLGAGRRILGQPVTAHHADRQLHESLQCRIYPLSIQRADPNHLSAATRPVPGKPHPGREHCLNPRTGGCCCANPQLSDTGTQRPRMSRGAIPMAFGTSPQPIRRSEATSNSPVGVSQPWWKKEVDGSSPKDVGDTGVARNGLLRTRPRVASAVPSPSECDSDPLRGPPNFPCGENWSLFVDRLGFSVFSFRRG